MKKFILILLASLSLWVIFTYFNSFPRKSSWFAAGSAREEVYAIMGSPNNLDDHIIAVWINGKEVSANWRELLDTGSDAYIAVFDEGKTIIDKRSFSQLNIPLRSNDEEILRYMKENISVQ